MVYAFLRVLFGADEFVHNVCNLLRLRKEAQAKHESNKELAAKLQSGTEELATLKDAYAVTKAQVEAGYALELD